MFKFPTPDIPGRDLIDSSAKIYAVGGAVRDALLGNAPHDIDFVIVGSSADEMLDAGLIPRGKDFPVFVTARGFEIALARTERKSGLGYTGFECDASKSVTLEDDLLRRDFTVNAIAYDISTNEIIDPLNGSKDLENKILRASSKAFREDPLRVLRAARFAARFGFSFDPDLIDECKSIPQEDFSALSKERIIMEFDKAFKECPKPSEFLNHLVTLDVIDKVMPEIGHLRNVREPIKYHPEEFTFIHIGLCLDAMKELSPSNKEMWTVFLHDLGKGLTVNPPHSNHDVAGVPLVHAFCKKYGLSNEIRTLATIFCKVHLELFAWPKLRRGTRVRMLDHMRVVHGFDILKSCLRCAWADSYGRAFNYVSRKSVAELGAPILLNALEFINVDTSDIAKSNSDGKRIADLIHIRRCDALSCGKNMVGEKD